MSQPKLEGLKALRDELPVTRIRLLRLVWPDIEAALQRGHTIRVIHQRLREAGIAISYLQLCRYVVRLRHEAANRTGNGDIPGVESSGRSDAAAHEAGRASGHIASPPDPLANIRERLIRNRPGFNYDPNLPDEQKLVGKEPDPDE